MNEMRLMVVEDDPHISNLICHIGQSAGYTVRAIEHASHLAELHESFRPDVIVLDVLMPDMDGFDVLHYLGDRDSRAKIVLLSGSHSYRDMAEKMGAARGLSIVANLAKPFRPPSLRLMLEEIRRQLATFPEEMPLPQAIPA